MHGQLQYTFECGSGPASAITVPKVNDGNWHNVTLERTGKCVIIYFLRFKQFNKKVPVISV